jgi:ABC-2 type transport system ATP-binding protein
MITVRNLSRKYGETTAVHDVSLHIPKGEIVGLLGHNGAGKTTIMKILTGYLEPTSGSVTIGGVDVVADRAGAQRQIGYLPENAPLYPEMLVQEYLFTMAELRGIPEAGRTRAVAEAVQQTGLAQHLLTPISALSKGYRQRVGIAQAILHKPEVLVLDEPTNGLDPMQIQSMRALIKRLGRTTTIILSTHILQEIEAVCDRVLVVINGRLVADSALSEILSSQTLRVSIQRGADRVEAKLRGVAGVQNVRRAEHDDEGFETWSVDFTGELPTPAIIRLGLDHGWVFGAIGREQRSLDKVFQRLQHEQVRAAEGAR